MDKTNTTAERFRTVRRQLRLTQQQLADELFLTRNYIAKIETGRQEPSMRAISALESLRVAYTNKNHNPAAEPSGPPDYRISGKAVHRELSGSNTGSGRMLHPKHSINPESPTRQDIEEHVKRYLDLAEKIPGGVAAAYYDVTDAMPLKKMQARVQAISEDL